MHHIQYHRPATVAEAARLLVERSGDKLIAGGQSLLPAVKLGLAAPDGYIDLSGVVELQAIRVEGDALRIGAMVTHSAVAASADVKRLIPALAQLAGHIGDRAVRNRGTLGGSVAHNDPAACYPAAVLGLGATVHTNSRTIAADDFFRGLFATALGGGEIVTAVSFPAPRRAGWVKFLQPASRFSLVGVFVASTPSGARVAVTGAAPGVFRVKALEERLNAKWAPESCDGVTIPADGLNDDLHGSAAYRAHLIPVLARRAVAAAG